MKMRTCSHCGQQLAGRQLRFCSRHCKNADTNHRHQNYVAQSNRGIRRKIALIQASGGRCTACGYSKNLAALTWHHLDPNKKSFELDMRSLSNRSDEAILSESAKCVLLCSNCHAEAHFPHLELASMGTK